MSRYSANWTTHTCLKMDRILRGIMKYRQCHREGMVKQFEQVRDNPEVSLHYVPNNNTRILEVICTKLGQ